MPFNSQYSSTFELTVKCRSSTKLFSYRLHFGILVLPLCHFNCHDKPLCKTQLYKQRNHFKMCDLTYTKFWQFTPLTEKRGSISWSRCGIHHYPRSHLTCDCWAVYSCNSLTCTHTALFNPRPRPSWIAYRYSAVQRTAVARYHWLIHLTMAEGLRCWLWSGFGNVGA